jgi:hypothetical protein
VRALAVAVGLAVALPARAAPLAVAWRYEVLVGADARELYVDARIDAPLTAAPVELSVDDGAEPFVRDVELEVAPGRFAPVAARGTSWYPQCAAGCRVRYRFQLGAAAARLDNEVAGRAGPLLQAPPTTWLLHPIGPARDGLYRFHVSCPPGVRFVSGVARAPDGDDSYQAEVEYLDDAPYSAFGSLHTWRQSIRGRTVEIAIADGPRALDDAALRAWIAARADAVAGWFGRFPVARALVLVTPSAGARAHGRTLGNGGATVLLSVGDEMTRGDLDEDWVLAHELTHLGLPNLPRAQRWMEEGLATYVEPLARARTGELSPEKVWGDLVAGLPSGLPERGDRGLDRTPTWGRIYWGGALFWLLADLEIRRRTDGRLGLRDALSAVVAAGGDMSVRWTVARLIAVADGAVGVPVLAELYAAHAEHAVHVDLPSLWRQLGVAVRAGRVVFDDTAPLASTRRAITARARSPRRAAGAASPARPRDRWCAGVARRVSR